MKKSFTLIVLAAIVLTAASCSSYTCPTYSKAAPVKEVRTQKI